MQNRIGKMLVGIAFVMITCVWLIGCDMDDRTELEDRIEDRIENNVKVDMEFDIESDMQNVEQRDYATILLVSSGKGDEDYEFTVGVAEEKKVGEKSQSEKVSTFLADDLEDLYEKYWSVKGKSLSLVHLKVILTEESEGQTVGYLWDFLEDVEESREIAKTCPVLQIADKDAFLKYVKDAKEPVGVYISDLIKMNEEKGKSIPWVKDYLKVMREGTSLQIYFLEEEKEGWQLKCRDEI